MAAPPGKFSAKIATIVVLIPLCILGWFISPLFLPRWRWINMDLAQLASQTGVPESDLRRQFTMVFRHAPRGDDDPVPWQIMTMNPPWDKDDEEKLMVRATIINDRSGLPPGSFQLGSGHRRDKYYQATGWRLPAGSFGFNSKRPVIVYDGGTFSKLETKEAEGMDHLANNEGWENDDDEVDDGWKVD